MITNAKVKSCPTKEKNNVRNHLFDYIKADLFWISK